MTQCSHALVGFTRELAEFIVFLDLLYFLHVHIELDGFDLQLQRRGSATINRHDCMYPSWDAVVQRQI